MNILDTAREHLSTYEKQRNNAIGLKQLGSGIDILYEIIQGDYPPDQKASARNMAVTYRKDAIKLGRYLLSERDNYFSEIEALDHCQIVLGCFTEINELIGPNNEFEEIEKEVTDKMKRVTEPEEIKMGELVDRIFLLSKDEQSTAVVLLEKLGVYDIRNALEKERRKQLKIVLAALPHALIKIIKEPGEKFIERIKDEIKHATGYGPERETIEIYLDNLTSLTFSTLEKGADTEKKQPDDGAQHEKVYTYSVLNAKARMVIKGGSYIVLKDSTAIEEERGSIPSNVRKKRRQLISSGALVHDQRNHQLRFTIDVSFDSPSAASCAISASSTNGWKCFNI